jgi:hypothetical protein
VLVAVASAIHRHLLMQRKALHTQAADRTAWSARSRAGQSVYPPHVPATAGGAQ